MAETKRQPISKKIRFEVFKRDDFTCKYCGNKPPNVMLEVDHIKPVSKGGTNNINNLITSCFDCNRGKSNIELKKIPNTLLQNQEILQEKEDQLKEYHKLIRKIENRINKEVEMVNERYSSYFEDYELNEKFKNGSLKSFLRKLDVYIVLEAMDTACTKMYNSSSSIRYFCGVCWGKIKHTKPPWEKD